MIQPTIFFGHGSPMNAIEENFFTLQWRNLVKGLPEPKAILVISAHYETNGVKIACAKNQKTIHDFYGFPNELFAVKYSAHGDFDLAKRILEILGEGEIDENWGLDHGAWSILLHTHPEPKMPILQLSLDRKKSPQEHFEFAKKLAILREEGVLIIGSGNIVHNLRVLDWKGGAYDWAKEFNDKIIEAILANDHSKVINFFALTNAKMAVPTSEHFLPLLYILALKKDGEKIKIFNDEIDLGSISMAGILISQNSLK
jgi:4,5-DOPA dioxygenase extradiol